MTDLIYMVDAVAWATLYGALGYLVGRHLQEHPRA